MLLDERLHAVLSISAGGYEVGDARDVDDWHVGQWVASDLPDDAELAREVGLDGSNLEGNWLVFLLLPYEGRPKCRVRCRDGNVGRRHNKVRHAGRGKVAGWYE